MASRALVLLTGLSAGVSAASVAPCAGLWAQCGGQQHDGATCCVAGAYCKRQNEWHSQCVPGAGPEGASPHPPATPAPATTPQPPKQPPAGAPAPPANAWDGEGMKMTHYWDCSGQGCDATTLQPWDKSRYVSPPGYGPQDPADFGGALYGEKMWLTGAASDALSALMGDDDGCCGQDPNDGGVGGCGKCVLVQNPDAVEAGWTAVAMKKNRCPPWSAGCGANQPHFDIAAPGFDNLQYSTANICGKQGTGFDSKEQSAALGDWYNKGCKDTAECADRCDMLPASFRKGCRLFAAWGWKRGNPDKVKFKAVPCPPEFVKHVGAQFGPRGVTLLQNATVEIREHKQKRRSAFLARGNAMVQLGRKVRKVASTEL